MMDLLERQYSSLIRSGTTNEELKQFLINEHRVMIDEQIGVLDVDTEYDKLVKRKALYDRDHSITFELDGSQHDRSVRLNDKVLSPERSFKIRNHSPDGFNWHYGGSGPAQLALAICIELFGEDKAQDLYQDFKWKIISKLPEGDFDVTINIKTHGNTILGAVMMDNNDD